MISLDLLRKEFFIQLTVTQHINLSLEHREYYSIGTGASCNTGIKHGSKNLAVSSALSPIPSTATEVKARKADSVKNEYSSII